MRFPRLAACLLAIAAASVVLSTSTRTASAQTYAYFPKTYKVQVEYWFFDTDYYYWSTVFQTSNQADAQFVYSLLLDAKEDGDLNAVAPSSYWRYIAVDVRLVWEYDFQVRAQPNYARAVPWQELD
jgi:hypothetical protein